MSPSKIDCFKKVATLLRMLTIERQNRRHHFSEMLAAQERWRFNQSATSLLQAFGVRGAPHRIVRLVVELRQAWGY